MNRIDTEKLRDTITGLISEWDGTYGVAVHDLDDPSVMMAVGGTQFLPTASTIKVPILVELLRQAEAGDLSLQSEVELVEDEQLGGSGILKSLSPGLRLTLRDAAMLMIVLSDNTATNLVLDAVGGVDPVNDAMNELGFSRIRLHNRIDFELIGPDVRRLGEAEPVQMSELANRIARGTAFSKGVSLQAEAMMSEQQYLDQVPRYFDYNPYWRELNQESSLGVACKTGFFTGTRVDVGIVRFEPGGGFSYCVANHECDDESFLPEAEGVRRNGLIGREVLNVWWPDAAGPAPVISLPEEADW